MKPLLLMLLLLISPAAHSQCDTIVKTREDKMTGKKSTSSVDISVTNNGSDGIVMNLSKWSEKSISWYIYLIGDNLGCVDQYADIDILFEDSTRMRLKSNTDFNCDPKAYVYFKGAFARVNDCKKLSTKPVIAIRVWMRKGYVQVDLSKEQSALLLKAFQCIQE